MWMSDWRAGVPLRSASMTRRQISTVAWSPRSFAASRTIQAVSSGLFGLDPSATKSGRLRASVPKSNEIAFIANNPLGPIVSMHRLRLTPQLGIGIPRILAGLIKFKNAPGCLDVEVAKLDFQIFQVLRGDA